jgi:hypothetical protein
MLAARCDELRDGQIRVHGELYTHMLTTRCQGFRPDETVGSHRVAGKNLDERIHKPNLRAGRVSGPRGGQSEKTQS